MNRNDGVEGGNNDNQKGYDGAKDLGANQHADNDNDDDHDHDDDDDDDNSIDMAKTMSTKNTAPATTTSLTKIC